MEGKGEGAPNYNTLYEDGKFDLYPLATLNQPEDYDIRESIIRCKNAIKKEGSYKKDKVIDKIETRARIVPKIRSLYNLLAFNYSI